MLKIFHDFHDPRREDDEGRIILHWPDDLKSERVELVEGMHVLLWDGSIEHEAILELVEQMTSDGPVDEWRARLLPGTFRFTDEEVPASKWIYEVIRKNDVYAAKCIKPEEKGKWDMTKEKLRNRWDLYVLLRSQWNLPCDEIEKLFKEADLAWYQEHKRRRELGLHVQQAHENSVRPMPIQIKIIRQGDDLYTAEVTAANGTWRSPPLPSFELISKLLRLGHNGFAIRRAFWDTRGAYPPGSSYRYAARIIRPFLQAALAGEWEVPEQRPFIEGWLAYALYSYEGLCPLDEVLGWADAWNHAIPEADEVSWAFLRLRKRGWLAIDGETYGLTSEGRRAVKEIVSRGKKPHLLLDQVRKLEKWFSDNPPPGD